MQRPERDRDSRSRQRAALPVVLEPQLKALREQQQAVRELEAQASAWYLEVQLRPERDQRIEVDCDGDQAERDVTAEEGAVVSAVREIKLGLRGWGTIRVVSGAPEAAKLELRLDAARSRLTIQLQDLGISSVEEGAGVLEQRKDLDRETRAINDQVRAVLGDWDSPDAMESWILEAEGDVARGLDGLGLASLESVGPPAILAADPATAESAVRSEEQAGRDLQIAMADQQARLEQAEAAYVEAGQHAAGSRSERAGLAARLQLLQERYPDGIEVAEQTARQTLANANGEFVVARQRLPADWESLGARQQRAVAAAIQAAEAFEAINHQVQRTEGVLAQAGSDGLYSRETMILESLSRVRAEAGRIERKAWAARLASALIDFRKRAAVRTVLQPLEDQLTAAFGELAGVPARRVFLDEQLQVRGIGATEDRSIAFDQLSQGAKEQLLLALRAAAALELTRYEPQLMILDDILVHIDAVRQQRVLDFLERLARDVQVLVVTCHPDRYRGVGCAIRWKAQSSGESW